MITKVRAISILVSVLLASGLSLAAQPKPPANASKVTASQVVGLVRTINTAEADAFLQGHQYLPLAELLKGRMFQRTAETRVVPTVNSDGSGTFGNYKVIVVSTADGQHYACELLPTSDCALAFFSDQSGVIYQGRVIGCPASPSGAATP